MPRTSGTWTKGQGGNFQSKDLSLVFHIKRIIAMPSKKRKALGVCRIHDLAESLVELAESGHFEALKLIMERLDGKVVDQLNVNVQKGPLLIASPLFNQLQQHQEKLVGREDIPRRDTSGEAKTPVSHSPIGNQAPRLVMDIEAELSQESTE